MAEDFDTPWKQALDALLEPFLEFFFPAVHAAIDWRAAPENLETELLSLTKNAEVGHRRADKLFRVRLASGADEMLLIHIEVQTTVDPALPRRVFTYWYRIFDFYDREPITLVLLGDDNPGWRPNRFSYRRFGFELSVEYPIVKLLDFAHREQELLEGGNPFGLEVMAYLKTRATRKDLASRLEWKLRLTRLVLVRGFEPKMADELIRLLDWMMTLPKELETTFRRQVAALKEIQGMRYITSFERFAREDGREEGLEQGRQQGLQDGLRKGQAGFVLRLLERRFGSISGPYLEKLETARLDQLSRWAERILEADSVTEVFEAD
jgi:hypothetical protein